MAHWAEIDKNNMVIRVLVTENDDPNGDEGYQWLVDNLGGRWVQTSYNARIRGKYAAIGDTYNEELDIFQAPKPPFPGIVDETLGILVGPTPPPDAGTWMWNEWTGKYEEFPDPPFND